MAEEDARLKRGTFTLDPDFHAGFKTAVRNGQSLLALEYLLELVTDMRAEIAELKAAQPAQKTAVKKAPAEEKVETA